MAKKSTLIANAQKYLQRGQLERAVREYQKALKLDSKDLRVRHKYGELLARQGDRNEALKELGVVAEAYASDGFYLKAVAVYKQQLKLRPDLFDVHQKLGDLYHRLNLVSEAMEHYVYVVHFYEANQLWEDCAEVYEQIIELKPTDAENYFKLAEFAAKSEDEERVIEVLQSAVTVLEGTEHTASLIEALERLLALNKAELSVHRRLADLYMQAGEFRKALSSLQVCFTADSQDVVTLSKLARVFEALNQMPKAVAVLKEMARLHDYHGRHEEKREALSRVAKINPSDPEVQSYFMSLAGATAPAPVPVAGNEAALVASPPEGLPESSPDVPAEVIELSLTPAILATGRLVTLPSSASAALQQVDHMLEVGAVDRAIRHLKEAAVREPACFALHDRLRQLLLAKGDLVGASRVILMQVKLAVAARAVEPARAAVAYALALTPSEPTVQMLATRLKVSEAAVIPEASEAIFPGERVPLRLDSAPTEDGELAAAKGLGVPGGQDGLVEDDEDFVEDAYDFGEDDGLVEEEDNFLEDDGLVDEADGLIDDDRLIDDGDGLVEEDDGLVDDDDGLIGSDDSLMEAGASLLEEDPMTLGASMIDDGLVEEDWTGPSEQTGTVSWGDGLVDDEQDAALLASIGDTEDTGALELDSIHLDMVDASTTLIGQRVEVEDEKTSPILRAFPLEELREDEDADDDSFDLAAELEEGVDNREALIPSSERKTDLKRGPYDMARAFIDMGLYDEAIRELHGIDFDAEGMHLMGLLQLGRGEFAVACQWIEAGLNHPAVTDAQRPQFQFDLGRARESLGQLYGALEIYRGLFAQFRNFQAKEVRVRIAAVTAQLQSSEGSSSSL